jgi:hypothetical protein
METLEPNAAEDHDAYVVVRLRVKERIVEVDEKTPVLGVPRLGPVEHDAGDPARVKCLVRHELVIRHLQLPLGRHNSWSGDTT